MSQVLKLKRPFGASNKRTKRNNLSWSRVEEEASDTRAVGRFLVYFFTQKVLKFNL